VLAANLAHAIEKIVAWPPAGCRHRDERGDGGWMLLNSCSTLSRLLYWKESVISRPTIGTPESHGVVPMNQSSNEKKGWSEQTAILSRPI
jgi:hypothetical protein